MENAPTITLNAFNSSPTANPTDFDRYLKWLVEVYGQIFITIPGRIGLDFYKIIKDNPEYPTFLSCIHSVSLKIIQSTLNNPERIAVMKDRDTWLKKGVLEFVWMKRYALIKSFRNEISDENQSDTRIENTPTMHLEAFRFREGDLDKYNKWMADYGLGSFVPLFMKLNGIKGYDFYQRVPTEEGLGEAREWEYPDFLSIIFFENLDAFETYRKSLELLSFKRAMHNLFPHGLNLKWYVQYQLVKSWRK